MITISVIIPCRNEVKYIEECIHAIYFNVLEDDVNLNVIVVDGISDDGTRNLLTKLQIQFSNLHIVDNEKQLTPFAFNLGIKHQNADFYQIVGARQILSKNYIQKSIEVFRQDDSVWCVGGAVDNVYVNYTGEMIARAMSTSFGMGLGNFRTLEKSSYTDTVGTPMYSAKVFEKIGFFDQDLVRNQDDDFNYRLTKAGGEIWFESQIKLKYYVRGSFKDLFRQFFQYGYWKVFVNKKHKSVTTLRQLVPPLFVLFTLTFPLIRLIPFIGFMGGIGFSLYFILAILFACKKSKSIQDIIYIIVTYPILHFSYGLGYLLGMFHFLLLNKQPSVSQTRLSR
jgi:GT2 family glycosyltransferase